MTSVFIVMEHTKRGNAIIVEVHEDKQYAEYKARMLRSSHDLYYYVIEHYITKTPL